MHQRADCNPRVSVCSLFGLRIAVEQAYVAKLQLKKEAKREEKSINIHIFLEFEIFVNSECE